MKNYFDKEFDLRYFEMDKFGEASPTTILTLLEETAADHCYSIGHSLYDLLKENVGWVLLSGSLQMERYPRYKEKIIIRTWISSYSSIRGFRENIIYDEKYIRRLLTTARYDSMTLNDMSPCHLELPIMSCQDHLQV